MFQNKFVLKRGGGGTFFNNNKNKVLNLTILYIYNEDFQIIYQLWLESFQICIKLVSNCFTSKNLYQLKLWLILPAKGEPVDITQLSLLLKVLPSGAEVRDSIPPTKVLQKKCHQWNKRLVISNEKVFERGGFSKLCLLSCLWGKPHVQGAQGVMVGDTGFGQE